MRTGKCSLLFVVIVFVILVVMAMVLFPMFASSHEPRGKAYCLNSLKQCAQALKMYADDYDGQMPSSYLVSHAKAWNRPDSLYFCTARGKFPPAVGAKQTWAQALYDHMKSPDIVFCPKDSVETNDPSARTSYWYKLANDKAWYGVGCPKPRRSMNGYGYEADQLAFYEHLGWHFADTSGLKNGVQICASFIDTHVETIVLRNCTSGDPLNCAVNADGEPMYYNTGVDRKDNNRVAIPAGPARLTDPTWSYDSF